MSTSFKLEDKLMAAYEFKRLTEISFRENLDSQTQKIAEIKKELESAKEDSVEYWIESMDEWKEINDGITNPKELEE